MGHETIYIDFMGHENSKKSVPWIESHPDIYVLMISWITHEFGAINTNIALRSSFTMKEKNHVIVNKYKKLRPCTGSILYTMNGSQSVTVVALF